MLSECVVNIFVEDKFFKTNSYNEKVIARFNGCNTIDCI